MSYLGDLKTAADGARKALGKLQAKHNIADEKLTFGGAVDPPKTIRAPSFADSKFQAEQALGDWAEGCLAAAINEQVGGLKAVHYGFSSKLVAGEPGFKEQYQAGIIDTCAHGKRADLLLLPDTIDCPHDISDMATPDTKDLTTKSPGAIEVRSSRLEAQKYIAYQAARKEAGNKVDSLTPNFTVKVEDLIIVYRWIELFGTPQAYAQVFLDEVHGISVLDILNYIAAAPKLTLVDPKRSAKLTIFVPITEGVRVGVVDSYPNLEVVDRVTVNGRHDIFARPTGGHITLDVNALTGLFA